MASPQSSRPGDVDGRRRRGDESRATILDRAVQSASRVGVEGLTFRQVAADAGVAKSNLRVLFGSKEGLQLATIAAARVLFVRHVIDPAIDSDTAIERLHALGQSWMDYLESEVFEGGCFFCAAATELDDRDGPLLDAVRSALQDWVRLLHNTARSAISAGDLDADPATVAFSLNAIGMAANFAHRLFRDPDAVPRARRLWADEINRHHVKIKETSR